MSAHKLYRGCTISSRHLPTWHANYRGPSRPLWQVNVQPSNMLPVDHSNSPFHELDLEELWKGIGKTRVRQHVNPLRREYQVPVGPQDWSKAFSEPTLPLILDLGCGPGRFLMLLHKRRLDHTHGETSETAMPTKSKPVSNYLGIEIREKLVERANEWVARLGYGDRIHYIYSNATISLASMMSNYPGKISSVYIQFPDPHFKKRHRKRRIFQPDLVRAICDLLPSGGQLFLQSDVQNVSTAMRNVFEKYAFQDFVLAPQHSGKEEDVFYSLPGSSDLEGEDGTGSEADLSDVGMKEKAQGVSSLPAAAASDQTGELYPGDTPRGGEGVVMGSDAAGSGGELAESLDMGAEGSSDDDGDFDNLESQWAAGGWLRTNPIGVPTEREHYVIQQGLPVYRVLLVKV